MSSVMQINPPGTPEVDRSLKVMGLTPVSQVQRTQNANGAAIFYHTKMMEAWQNGAAFLSQATKLFDYWRKNDEQNKKDRVAAGNDAGVEAQEYSHTLGENDARINGRIMTVAEGKEAIAGDFVGHTNNMQEAKDLAQEQLDLIAAIGVARGEDEDREAKRQLYEEDAKEADEDAKIQARRDAFNKRQSIALQESLAQKEQERIGLMRSVDEIIKQVDLSAPDIAAQKAERDAYEEELTEILNTERILPVEKRTGFGVVGIENIYEDPKRKYKWITNEEISKLDRDQAIARLEDLSQYQKVVLEGSLAEKRLKEQKELLFARLRKLKGGS